MGDPVLFASHISDAAREDAIFRTGGYCERCFKFPTVELRQIGPAQSFEVTADDLMGFCQFCLDYLEGRAAKDPEERWAKGWGPILRRSGLLGGVEPETGALDVKLEEYRNAYSESPAESYLAKRGFSAGVAERMGLGFAKKWVSGGSLAGRLVFPATNPLGGVTGLFGRALPCSEKTPVTWEFQGVLPGYFGGSVLGISGIKPIVCQNPFDALALMEAGANGVLAVGLSPWRWSWAIYTAGITLAFDPKSDQTWSRIVLEEADSLNKPIQTVLPPSPYQEYSEALLLGGIDFLKEVVRRAPELS